ncbi:MAG: N-acetylmannosamine-6-phosphate 2-epimerase [Chloroflexota bacterium]|nr:N-acetylmannosamine-6-phosphate 2-epimerase [Chloroflexota bacterium]
MTSASTAGDELRRLVGGLVVSCQARNDNPLHGPRSMALMARAAVLGGARGIRANGEEDIAAIRSAVDVPILGINKVTAIDGTVFITPTAASAQLVIAAGARLVALDGTARPRLGGESLAAVIAAIHDAGALALADVATTDDADHAVRAGADAVGTTLSGYTADSPRQDGPDFALLTELVKRQAVPVFAEGRIWTAEQARRALALGAAFVVVGTAITNPMATTAKFVSVMGGNQGGAG